MALEYIEEKILASGSRTGLVVHRPKNFDISKQYPLIIFHPGIGERGVGNEASLEQLRSNWSVTDLEVKSKDYDFITVEVQPRDNYQDGETDEGYEWAKATYGNLINWKQVYLTGLSLGGGGVQRYLSTNANAHEKFAAAVINCPGPNQYFVVDYNKLVNTKVPMWFFHNSGDATVTPAQSTLLTEKKVQELKGTAKLKVTIYNRNGHTWPSYSFGKGTKAATPALASGFNNPNVNIYEWLLSNEVGKPAVLPPAIGDIIPPIDPNPEVPPVNPLPDSYITGINVSGDVNFSKKNLLSSVVEIYWSNGSYDVVRAPADLSDRIKGAWTVLKDGKLKVSVDFEKAETKVFGPIKK